MIWDDKRAPINEATFFIPIEDGGRALLDLWAQNEVISVMWLRSYLDLGPDRPLWVFIADALFGLNAGNDHPELRQNIFLQSWSSSNPLKLCPDLKQLINTAKSYGLCPEGIAFSKDVLHARLIWLHSNADARI